MTGPQWRAFIAAYLGWTLDAFDYFLLVLLARRSRRGLWHGPRGDLEGDRPHARHAAGRRARLRSHRRPFRPAPGADGQHPSLCRGRAPHRLRPHPHRVFHHARDLRHRHGRRMGRRGLDGHGVGPGEVPRAPFRRPAAGLSDGLPPGRARRGPCLSRTSAGGHLHPRLAARAPRALHPAGRAGVARVARGAREELGAGPGAGSAGHLAHASASGGRSSSTWSCS